MGAHLHDGEIVVRVGDPAPGMPGGLHYVVEVDGEAAGRVALGPVSAGSAELRWEVDPAFRGRGISSRSVRLVVTHAFGELGLERVCALVDLEDRASLRAASVAGLRREGVERGAIVDGDERRDGVRLARLSSDPEPLTPEGFRGILNAGLSRTRVIAQGLLRDDAGRVLLCELTYKRFWDLPGGVVDPGESPAAALVREIREEIGVAVRVDRLAAVNWLPPWQGWDDACLFLFEVSAPDGAFASVALEPREIRALHWCPLDQADEHVADYTMRMIRAVTGNDPAAESSAHPELAARDAGAHYLEDGRGPA